MRYGGSGPSWFGWVSACETWPAPWEAIEVSGGWWWLVRVLAYRNMKYQIEHEQPIDEGAIEWPAEEGW